jgi:hypothetical protein
MPSSITQQAMSGGTSRIQEALLWLARSFIAGTILQSTCRSVNAMSLARILKEQRREGARRPGTRRGKSRG